MDSAPESDVEPIVIDDSKKRKIGHRQEDHAWDYFTKIKLSEESAAKLHRNYDARCKSCSETVVGQPSKMKQHLTKQCKHISQAGQLHIFAKQAAAGNSVGSTSASQPQQSVDGPMAKYVDKVPVTKTQKNHWWKLLCIAFIMTGWSFMAVENEHFRTFMQHVRPNFVLPSAYSAELFCALHFSAVLHQIE